MSRWLILVVWSGLTGCGDVASPAAVDPAIARGQAAYDRYCALCHGDDGEGYVGAQAVALGNDAFLRTASDAFLGFATLEGRPGTRMSAYGTDTGGHLGDTDARDIVAYLRTWQEGESIPVDFAVEGDAGRGAGEYAMRCAVCHGDAGQGATACSLDNPVFLRTASDGFLRVAIDGGRPGTAMAAYGDELSDTELDDIVAHLRSLE